MAFGNDADVIVLRSDNQISYTCVVELAGNKFVELASNALQSDNSYEHIRLIGGFAESTVEDVQFEFSNFLSADLSKTRWTRIVLNNSSVEKCDLANAQWHQLVIDSVEIGRCRATGMQLLDSKWTNSSCHGTKYNLASFHGSKLRDATFENCDFREANFEGSTLARVTFRNCDLRMSRFQNCKFDQVDFRGSQIGHMQVDLECLRRACVNPAQLLDIAAGLGIRVREIGEGE